MKTFFLGILATVVGGLLLLWSSNAFNDWRHSGERLIRYKIDAAATFIGREELSAIADMLDKKEKTAKVALVTVANSGTKPLKNARFYIRSTVSDQPTEFYGYGVAATIEGDTFPPAMEGSPSNIKVTIPFLKPSQGVVFWIAHKPPQNFEVVTDDDSIQYEEEYSDYLDESSVDYIIYGSVVAVIFLVIGITISEAISRWYLRKAGYDPKVIQAAYLRNVANEAAQDIEVK